MSRSGSTLGSGWQFVAWQHALYWVPALAVTFVHENFRGGEWFSDLFLLRSGLSGLVLDAILAGWIPHDTGRMVLVLAGGEGLLLWLARIVRSGSRGVRITFWVVNALLMLWSLAIGFGMDFAAGI